MRAQQRAEHTALELIVPDTQFCMQTKLSTALMPKSVCAIIHAVSSLNLSPRQHISCIRYMYLLHVRVHLWALL